MLKNDKNLDEIDLYELTFLAKENIKSLFPIPFLIFALTIIYFNFIAPNYKFHTEIIALNLEASNEVNNFKLMLIDLNMTDSDFIEIDLPNNKSEDKSVVLPPKKNKFVNIPINLSLDEILSLLKSEFNFGRFIQYDPLNKYANLHESIIYDIYEDGISNSINRKVLHANLLETNDSIYDNFLTDYINYTVNEYFNNKIILLKTELRTNTKLLDDTKESISLGIESGLKYSLDNIQVNIEKFDVLIDLCRKYAEKCFLDADGEVQFSDLIYDNILYDTSSSANILTLKWLIEQKTYLEKQKNIKNIENLYLKKYDFRLKQINEAYEYNKKVSNEIDTINLKDVIYIDEVMQDYIHNLASNKYTKGIGLYSSIAIALLLSFISAIFVFVAYLFYRGYVRYSSSISKN